MLHDDNDAFDLTDDEAQLLLFLETCRATRTDQVAEDRDFAPTMEVIRPEGTRAHVMCPGDRDYMLRGAAIAVPGFGASRLLVCMDAYGAHIPWKQGDPLPEMPQRGSYQAAWEAGERDGLMEQLVVMSVDRNPYHFTQLIQPYITNDNKTITWDDPYAPEGEDSGYVSTAFRIIMEGPDMMQMLREQAERDGRTAEFEDHYNALAPAQRDYHSAVAVCRILTEQGYAVAMWATTEEATWSEGREDVIVGRPGEDMMKAAKRHELKYHTKPFVVGEDS